MWGTRVRVNSRKLSVTNNYSRQKRTNYLKEYQQTPFPLKFPPHPLRLSVWFTTSKVSLGKPCEVWRVLRSHGTITWAPVTPGSGHGLGSTGSHSLSKQRYHLRSTNAHLRLLKEIWGLASQLRKFLFAFNKQPSVCGRNEEMQFKGNALSREFSAREKLMEDSYIPKEHLVPFNIKKATLWSSPDKGFIKDLLITSFNSYLTSQTKLAKLKQEVKKNPEEGTCSPPPHCPGCTSGLSSGYSQTEWETHKASAKQNSRLNIGKKWFELQIQN